MPHLLGYREVDLGLLWSVFLKNNGQRLRVIMGPKARF